MQTILIFFFFMHGHGLMSQRVEWLEFCMVLSKVLQNTDIKKKKKKKIKSTVSYDTIINDRTW
jgi:hypothetical protein